MRKLTYSICFLLVSFTLAQSQAIPVPAIPNNVAFAGMNIKLDADARAVIQTDIKALFTNKKFWDAKLDRCVQFFPLIEGVLVDEAVPNDFKYLAVQESSLQPDAISASNAVGFWQFKKETALDYGLRVDDQIDERKHITAATKAAAQYLKKSNGQFNNWLSSLYSYYLGAGTIAKTIPTDWSYAREVTLDGKTDRYLLRFLAHKIAIESSIDRYQSPNPVALLEYANVGGRNLENIARDLSLDLTALRAQNRWLTTNDIPTDKTYSLIVPVRGDQVEGMRELIAAKAPATSKRDDFAQSDIGFPVLNRAQGYSSNLLLYEINGLPGIMAANGDDAAALAKKSKISFSSFLRYNDLSEQMDIEPGQVYYLAKKNKRAAIPYHTVREGETLWKVSQIYGLRLKHLLIVPLTIILFPLTPLITTPLAIMTTSAAILPIAQYSCVQMACF
ncbi:MAG: transglycosylase SLT domain-containing protein [Spirosomaceae bacterium]|nr:transglycosylase SLT domain-containing protein [Spirosomataceae bacterium]